VSRSPAVNVQTFINEHPFSGFQWLIFTMCFVIVLLDGFDTAAIGFRISPALLSVTSLRKLSTLQTILALSGAETVRQSHIRWAPFFLSQTL
jgi:hypothetical protein